MDLVLRDGFVKCFPFCYAEHFFKQRWLSSRPHLRVLVQDDKKCIVGNVSIVIRDVFVGDSKLIVKVAGIQGVFIYPKLRGTGLGHKIMKKAMLVAYEQDRDIGLLFCYPYFENYYKRIKWRKIETNISMQNEQGDIVLIPSDNISMICSLKKNNFPPGDIYLNGADW